MSFTSGERSRGARWVVAALFAVAAGLTGAACDKVPLLAPSGSTISLFASSSIVPSNGTVEIIATVIESSGTPVHNGTTVTFFTTLGTMDPMEATTKNGKATVHLVAGTQSGEAHIRAASGSFQTTEADALVIKVGSAAAGSVQLTASSLSLPAAGGTVNLLAAVLDIAGNRLPGVNVSFSSTSGTLGQSDVVSDSNGEARTTLAATADATVTATVSGATPAPAPATINIKVRIAPGVSIGTASPNPATAGQPVVIPVTITVAAGGAAVRTATIDFGDGSALQTLSTSGLTNAVHTYARSGTWVTTATAVDAAGESGTATMPVIVKPQAPIPVTISVSANPTSNTVTTFTGNATLPAGAAIESWDWNFGNGVTKSGNSPIATCIYALPGTYSVSLTVTTTDGASGFTQIDVIVQGTTSTVSLFVSDSTPSIGVPVTFTATVASGLVATQYRWSFGDGSFPQTSTANAIAHTFTAANTYTVTVTVTLSDGSSASASLTVVVS